MRVWSTHDVVAARRFVGSESLVLEILDVGAHDVFTYFHAERLLSVFRVGLVLLFDERMDPA